MNSQIQVTITKSARDKSIGMKVDDRHPVDNKIRVLSVDQKAASQPAPMQKYNDQKKKEGKLGEQVEAGDYIVGVNGKTEPAAMMEEMKTNHQFQFKVEKKATAAAEATTGPAGAAPAGAILQEPDSGAMLEEGATRRLAKQQELTKAMSE